MCAATGENYGGSERTWREVEQIQNKRAKKLPQKMQLQTKERKENIEKSHRLQQALLGWCCPAVTTFSRTWRSCDVERTKVKCQISLLLLPLNDGSHTMRVRQSYLSANQNFMNPIS